MQLSWNKTPRYTCHFHTSRKQQQRKLVHPRLEIGKQHPPSCKRKVAGPRCTGYPLACVPTKRGVNSSSSRSGNIRETHTHTHNKKSSWVGRRENSEDSHVYRSRTNTPHTQTHRMYEIWPAAGFWREIVDEQSEWGVENFISFHFLEIILTKVMLAWGRKMLSTVKKVYTDRVLWGHYCSVFS